MKLTALALIAGFVFAGAVACAEAPMGPSASHYDTTIDPHTPPSVDPASGQFSAPHIDTSTILISNRQPSYLQIEKFAGRGNRYVCVDNLGDLYVSDRGCE
jgi:hypothetical protein